MKILADAVQEVAIEKGLGDREIFLLNKDAPRLVDTVKNNITEKKSDPFNGMSDEDKRLLLAFVVYKRQNITTSPTDNPNDEDAARILRKKVFQDDPKRSSSKIMKDLEEELAGQLTKAGLPVSLKK